MRTTPNAVPGRSHHFGELAGRLSRILVSLALLAGLFAGAVASVVLATQPAAAATASISCSAPASGGTATTFDVGTAASYTVTCSEVTGISGTSAYPTSITLNTGHLPADATEATSTSSSPACTTATSGSGTSESYELECKVSETPTVADEGTYPVTFTATPGTFTGSTLTAVNSGTWTLTVAPATVSCIDPASGGTSTTFYEGSTNTYTVECESQSGISGVTAYPSALALASGSLPADGNPTLATSTSSSPACTTATSGTGATEEYILECGLADTPTASDGGSYPLTFTATGVGGAGSVTSGTLTVNVSPPTTSCSAPAAGGTATSFTVGTASSYTVTCYSEGFATASAGNYPASITVNTGTLPADATFANSLTSSPACTTATSGSGLTEEYELECKVTETPTVADEGTYPVTFLASGGTNGLAPNAVSGTWTLSVKGTAPTFPADQYTNAESGQPFCYDAQAATVTAANGGLPLTSITVGSAPAGVTNWGLQDINLATGSAYVCGTETAAASTTGYSFTVTFANSGGSATGTIDLYDYGQCTWTASSGTSVSMFDAPQDLEQAGSQSAFGQPITNGETPGTTTNYPTCTDAEFYAPGLSGGAFTVNTANALPGPTDTNPSASQGDLASSNLDLAKGCYGDAVVDLGGGAKSSNFGSAAILTLPSPWANGGTCSYGSLGSNEAGGNTDTTNASCPPSQADVNAGYVSCSITASTGNDNNASYNNTTMDLFINGQPVPQQSTAALSSSSVAAGGALSVTGGTNWWGSSGGAPNSGPYGDDQVGAMYPVGAPGVYIGTTRATAVPVLDSTVTISPATYVCTGAESATVGPNPCTFTPGQPSGSFQVPEGLAPGNYNLYIDESNTTPLPGNGPNDSYQTARGTNLGTAESVTPITVAPDLSLVKTATTSAYGAAGDTIDYQYLVTNNGPSTLSNIAVSDDLIPSVSCPDPTLAPGGSETCTGSYTVTQTDVDAGSVTNTATASGTTPDDTPEGSNASTVTVPAGDATSSLSLSEQATSSGYGAAGNSVGFNYQVTNTGTRTLTGVAVSSSLASVSCPEPSLAPGGTETCSGSYTVTQADVDAGSVTDSSTASATDPQSNTVTSNGASATVAASGASSNLSVTTTATTAGYGADGDVLGFSYQVTNNGTTDLHGVAVTDNLGDTITCTSSTLAPGDSETCTASYTVSQADVDAGSVTDTATAAGESPGGSPIASAPSSATVPASEATSSLSVTTTATTSGYGAAGNTVDFAYDVLNTGTTTLADVAVTDNLGATTSCPHPSLGPGASETCTGSYAVSQADVDAGSVTETATAGAESPSGAAVTSSASSATVPASEATSSLSVTTTATTLSYAAAGNTVDFAYKVTNTGTTTLSGVAVTDNLGGSNNCSGASLFPYVSISCSGFVIVTQADVDAGAVTETATATATSPGGATVTSAPSSATVEAASCSPPAITSPTTASATVGVPFSFTIRVCDLSIPTLHASGLPAGLALSTVGGAPVISGTPLSSADGVHAVILKAKVGATNATLQTATSTLTITVARIPAISSWPSAKATVGEPFSFTVKTNGTPYGTISETSSPPLPASLQLVDGADGTAVLSGTPVPGDEGTYHVTFSATNRAGTGTQAWTLTIYRIPVFTSPDTATVAVNQVLNFDVTTTAYPVATITGGTGLPAGFHLTATGNGTATITGSPSLAQIGTYTVTLRASNAGGHTDQTLTLTVT